MNRHLTPDERTALALGLATKNETELWDAHLSECESCRQELTCDREMVRLVAECEPPECSRERWDGMVREALDELRPAAVARPAAATSATPANTPQSLNWRAWALRAASLLVVFGLGYHLGANHATEREMRADYAESQPWAGQAVAPAVLPRPTPQDLPPTSGSYAARALMVKAEDITRRL